MVPGTVPGEGEGGGFVCSLSLLFGWVLNWRSVYTKALAKAPQWKCAVISAPLEPCNNPDEVSQDQFFFLKPGSHRLTSSFLKGSFSWCDFASWCLSVIRLHSSSYPYCQGPSEVALQPMCAWLIKDNGPCAANTWLWGGDSLAGTANSSLS